jgi:hypothetical protein
MYLLCHQNWMAAQIHNLPLVRDFAAGAEYCGSVNETNLYVSLEDTHSTLTS